jgi:hypothetical protein
MSRISALPTLQYCSGSALVDKQVEELEFTRTLRGTVFHHYCEKGEWPPEFAQLPKKDQDEIRDWKVPYGVDVEGFGFLAYQDAEKEAEVSLRFGVGADEHIPGHVDMHWLAFHQVTKKLYVIVNDIKSNARAVADGTESLQLHGYGMALCQKYDEVAGYLPGIYSASDGTWIFRREPVDRDSMEYLELEDTFARVLRRPFSGYHIGTHCGGCFKRTRCPAYLIETHEAPTFARVISGQANAGEAREALVMANRMKASLETIEQALKDWVVQHGPIPSEDGKKSWRPHDMPGRESLDKRKLFEFVKQHGGDPEDFMSVGNRYQVFSWKKVGK